MPIWEHVGHALADRNSPVRVAKLDCTRYTNVAAALNIRGYPTVIFFRNGVEMVYDGERKKEALVDFAMKASGPIVSMIDSGEDFSKILHSMNEPFFVYISNGSDSQLFDEYNHAAQTLFSSTRFYHSSSVEFLPSNVSVFSLLPTVVVFKDNSFLVYDHLRDSNLTEWIHCERWSLMPLITSSNIKEVGKFRLLVLSVINMVERKNDSTSVGKFQSVMTKTAALVREDPRLSSFYQFGWLDGNELVNNIILGTMHQPGLVVFNVSSYEYYLSDDIPIEMTVQSLLSFLERILSDDVKARGGRSLQQRIKRIFYEIATNIYDMFKAQPLLTASLFGVPIAFLSLITYCLCSTDFSVDRDEIYPDEDVSDTDGSDYDGHEKAE
ncbi:unnamed protein product [Dracunculus medinensis]|uniref:Thioredoxin domain-containing protein n=1 Tax=Dracunculus medinensis TaxID=318479 RepID=A0A0N4U780_DRAME|nr:unnamed protein product [Dracunculus medinensis]